MSRDDAQYYDGLLAASQIDQLVSRSDGRYPAIRLAKGGGFFPPEAYTRNVNYGDELFQGVPDVEKIFTEYLAGATVSLPALHLTWPPLRDFCTALEAELDHAVHANVYITPAGAKGFTPHFDSHEVFILQIAGAKHWRVWPGTLRLPHRSQLCSPQQRPGETTPTWEFDLHAGDLLYLPRGFVHAATTSEHFSAHITVGVTVYTWVELAMELLQEYLNEERFREALPNGFASRADVTLALKTGLAERLNSVHRQLDIDRVVEAFTQRVRQTKSRSAGTFHADVTAIGPETKLRLSSKRPYQLHEEGENAVLVIDERRLVLPAATKPLLDAICAGEAFTPRSLSGGISLDGRLSLLRLLHGLGFIGPASSA